jgi:hypothetical protein
MATSPSGASPAKCAPCQPTSFSPATPRWNKPRSWDKAIKGAVNGPFRIDHGTLELECEACNDAGEWCELELDTAQASAPDTNSQHF